MGLSALRTRMVDVMQAKYEDLAADKDFVPARLRLW